MTRSAFIAIIGKPNVGKSSILNRLTGSKIAIVSSKPQTTRTKIMGVLTRDEVQLVFTDTPGFHHAHNKLGEHMNQAVWIPACLWWSLRASLTTRSRNCWQCAKSSACR